MPTTVRNKVILALTICAFVICYAGVASSLVWKWSTNYVYSYGFAVPLISAYLVWVRWPRIEATPWEPSLKFGMSLVVAGACALLTGHLAALIAVQQLSLVVTLSGLLLVFCGRRAFAVLCFPIFYLVIGLPVWDYPINLLQEPSRTLSARIALAILHPLGIPALREGFHLILPTVTLDVLRECSGVNQLVAIVAMSLPAGFLWLETYSRRIVLLAVAIITAYLSNGLRIALIGALAYYKVKGAHDTGFLHVLQGLFVSALGYVLIGACLSILARTERRREPRLESAHDSQPAQVPNGLFQWTNAVVLGVLLATGGYITFFRPADIRLREDFSSIPLTIGAWTAEPASAPTAPVRFIGADNELTRTYRHESGARVRLYVAYHRYQADGKELGNASRALAGSPITSTMRVSSEDIEVRQIDPKDAGSSKAAFWYDVNGRIVGNVYLAKAYTVWDALTRGRTNGAVVVIDWNPPTSIETTADADPLQFAETLVPYVRRCLPSSVRTDNAATVSAALDR